MACDCIETSEQNILNKLKEDHPEWTFEPVSGYDDLGLQNIGLSLAANGGRYPYFPYKYKYTFVKTNGETSKPKTSTVNITGNFCPFCGKKR